MNAAHVSNYRKQLLEMKTRLESGITNLEQEALQPTAAQTALGSDKQSDPGACAAEERVARTLLCTESDTLAEINAALDRMEQGGFGTCNECGAMISQARLTALPYARACSRCAKRAETLA